MASIIGSEDVCDYLDFAVVPGAEEDFFTVLLDDLKQNGISQLELKPLRPDSAAFTHFVPLAEKRRYEVVCQDAGVSVELDLPATFDDYLMILSKKQRHEVRRKLRRLWESGKVEYLCTLVGQKEAGAYLDTFLRFFALSHEEKANFMTTQMESFFRSLADAMAEAELLRFGVIGIDGQTMAMIVGFDYNDALYLYNSAYDPAYGHLSVGLLSKVLCLKESIDRGRKKWDFLKGAEPYKYRIGGREIPLHSCRIVLK